MADAKISALTELAEAPADTDELAIVDKSDETDAATGTTKRITAANVRSGLVPSSLVDAKGDLIVASAADTVVRLPVGTDDHVLTADAAEAGGVKWAAAAGGGGASVPTYGAIMPILQTGDYGHLAPSISDLSLGVLLANESRLWPLTVQDETDIDGLTCRVTTASSDAGSVIRLGIWANSGNAPTTIIAQGTVAADSTGAKTAAFTAVTLQPGIYWCGPSWQEGVGGTGPSVLGVARYQGHGVMGVNPALSVATGFVTSTRRILSVTGAFVDNPTAAALALNASSAFVGLCFPKVA